MGRRARNRLGRQSASPTGSTALDRRSRASGLVLAACLAVAALAGTIAYLSNRDGGTGEEILEPTAAWDQSSAQYVDATACQGCHAEIWETYRHTAMARSFFRPRPENTVEDYSGIEAFHHDSSDRFYRMIRRDGRYFQRRYQEGQGRAQTNVVEKEIHYVMGSGNHARTYLHLSPSGKLVQLPLGWYADDGGKWAMSPGYDRPDHDGFQRVISFDCIFCHNGYPEVETGADMPGRLARYSGAIPEGIDCQRCHGPGSAHVNIAGAGEARTDAIRASIINPARLSPELEADVCYQCHLESTSRPLPNIVHKYGRGYFSFRPGEPLSSYALYFDHAPETGWDDKFEINHSAYRLRQSPCFEDSGGNLSCTTCHDPHKPAQTDEASLRYDAACLKCHSNRLESLAALGNHRAVSGCVACHMPKRRTDDVVHAIMTDHLIQASPPPDLTSPKRERSTLAETAYRGEVKLYYPARHVEPTDELYSAVAQVAQGSHLEAGIARLESSIRHHNPSEAGFYFDLGAAHEEAGQLNTAARWFDEAIVRDPTFALARIRNGSVLSQAGKHARAEEVLSLAAALDPSDPRIPKERGMNFARQGKFALAAEANQGGIALDPDLPEFHNNLGGALAELGRFNEAESSLEEAVRLQPDLAEARFNLGTLLAARGDLDGAVIHWRAALRSQPDYAAARYNYAVVLATKGNWSAALAQLEALLETEPDFQKARALRDELSQARN